LRKVENVLTCLGKTEKRSNDLIFFSRSFFPDGNKQKSKKEMQKQEIRQIKNKQKKKKQKLTNKQTKNTTYTLKS
jgi:hypothetical protein